MKLLSIAAALLMVTSCTVNQGSSQGNVIDVSYGGVFSKTCEVDVQYGEQSSKVARFSSPDKSMCDFLEPKVGKTVTIKYDNTKFKCFTCGSHDLITNVTVTGN